MRRNHGRTVAPKVSHCAIVSHAYHPWHPTSGTRKVSSVSVSTDGGKNWKKAKLIGPDLGKFAWRQFVFNAKLKPGKYNIASKASSGGKSQPKLRMENRRGYAHNGWRDHSLNISVS